jgi:hypothetical protein
MARQSRAHRFGLVRRAAIENHGSVRCVGQFLEGLIERPLVKLRLHVDFASEKKKSYPKKGLAPCTHGASPFFG